MVNWLAKRWVAAALFMGMGFIALGPAIAISFSGFLTLIYLHLPIYMLHQFEEHAGDRFRHFTNTRLFAGKEVLRPVDVIVVNIPLVWGVNLFAFYMAVFVKTGLGLVAPYLLLVNAVLHIVTSLRFRCYNPGIATAIAFFIPLSLITLMVSAGTPGITMRDHFIALIAALFIHVAIMAQAGLRLHQLR